MNEEERDAGSEIRTKCVNRLFPQIRDKDNMTDYYLTEKAKRLLTEKVLDKSWHTMNIMFVEHISK